MSQRKCVHVYHYFDDPELGFGHVRLQTWLPFTVQICLNGRHWLERQMQHEGIAYLKDGNCFPYIADPVAAQRLMDQQLCTDWPRLLNRLLATTCPAIDQILAPLEPRYYWSADETEYASDLMFRNAGELARLYPQLIRHAIVVADTPAVMRFFGKCNLTAAGKMKGRAPEEVCTDLRRRAEGLRIKHWHGENSIKAYDKGGSILRIETTINKPRDFKTYRSPNDDPKRKPSWQRLRKGVSDLHRRCQVSEQCNQRYALLLASAHTGQTLKELTADPCQRRRHEGKPYRGLNPWHDDDFKLLSFLGQGQWAIHGFRNRDLRTFLFPHLTQAKPATVKQGSARVSRLIRLLRAHGLARKVPHENRYVPTTKGQTFAAALLTASASTVQKLTEMSA